jgi:PAS domain S-box-containing protein
MIFRVRSQNIADAIGVRVREMAQLLRGGAALFGVGDNVDAGAWRAYVNALRLRTSHPDILAIGYAPLIAGRERGEIAPSGARQGMHRQAWRTPILFIEPLDAINRQALGFDMYSDPTRREAMDRARASREAALSGTVVLVKDTRREASALLYVSVYGRGKSPTGTRRDRVTGYVYAAFRTAELIKAAVEGSDSSLALKVLDSSNASADSVLFDNDRALTHSGTVPTLRRLVPLELQGRTWFVSVAADPDFMRELDDGKADYALASGALASLLMFVIAWFSASIHIRASELARQMARERTRSEAQLGGIVETAMDAIISTDESQSIILFNSAAESLFGWTKEQVLGQPLDRLLPQRFRDRHRRHIQRFGTTGETHRAMGASLDLFGLRANGEEFPIDASISRHSEDDRLVYTVILRDITARKRTEKSLAESTRLNQEILNSASEGIVVLDRALRHVLMNPVMRQMCGLDETDVTGRHIWEVFPQLADRGIESSLARALAGETVVSSPEDLDISWTLATYNPHRNALGEIVGVLIVVVDVTVLTQQRARLERANARLHQLSDHLETVRESERTRIAREIHDDLGATLTGIKMDLSAARKEAATDPSTFEKSMNATLVLIDNAVQATRRIINDLRPSVLDNLGVWAAIEWQAHETAQRARIACEVDIDAEVEDINLSNAGATALFRIVQESLNNVWRHAYASRVSVHARRLNHSVQVEIRDDGRGFDQANMSKEGHWGIAGMYERVRTLGGELKLTSSPGKGTWVNISVPVDS